MSIHEFPNSGSFRTILSTQSCPSSAFGHPNFEFAEIMFLKKIPFSMVALGTDTESGYSIDFL